jgi:phosphate:Na+ symporter
MEAPVLGALVGAVFTVMVQSSSATLGVIITLATQGLISLPAGIAMMLGAEIGTCADTLMATVGRSREAVRAGVFHLLFNVITVSIGVALAHPFTAFIQYISAGTDLSRQIANAHVLFNVAGVVLFIGFVTPVARVLQWLIPDKKKSKVPEPAIEPGVA